MTKPYADCKDDRERAEFFRSGDAHTAGIIAAAIQDDVADAFAFRAEVAEMLTELQAVFQRRTGEGASMKWRAAFNFASSEIGEAMAKLGIGEAND